MAPSGGFSASTPPLRIPLPRLENNRGNQVETQIRHPVPPVPPGQTPPIPPPPPSTGRQSQHSLICFGEAPVGIVALSQNSQQLGLSPSPSFSEELGAPSFFTPNRLDSGK